MNEIPLPLFKHEIILRKDAVLRHRHVREFVNLLANFHLCRQMRWNEALDTLQCHTAPVKGWKYNALV